MDANTGGPPQIGGKPPKWMVKIMENPIKIDDLGGKNPIFGNAHVFNQTIKLKHCGQIGKKNNREIIQSWTLLSGCQMPNGW